MPTLKKAVLKGSAWTMLSIGSGQIIRLGKSLILSRLLFPDAYGVMAIVWAVLYALELLSDVGISSGIIRSSRGDDPDFLNTAWTMKVVRGVVLFFIALLSAYPISIFYHQPDLVFFIPIAGITTLIEGFGSTNLYSCQRAMIYDRLTLLEFSNELVGLVVTLIWAYLAPSVWALLGGAVIGRIYHVFAGHVLLPGIKNRIHWDKNAFRELLHFGKWVLFSSAVYLCYTQGDRMLLAKYLDIKILGVYSIAIMLGEAVSGVVTKLNDNVLYPALSRIVNTERERLRDVFYRARLGTDALMLMPIAVLMMIGSEIVNVLYDSRYHEAGWMLQILCVRLLMVAMLVSSASCMFALGHSQYAVAQNILRATWLFIGIPLVWPLAGIHGVVWVVALTEIPVIFILWYGMAKHNVLSVLHELRSLLFIGSGLLLGWILLQLPIGSR